MCIERLSGQRKCWNGERYEIDMMERESDLSFKGNGDSGEIIFGHPKQKLRR